MHLCGLLAKRGASFEDRLVLGYHANSMKMALVYSRDSAARPLALLSHVLGEIKQDTFDPDCTRSGRLKANAIPLDQVEPFLSNPMFSSFRMPRRQSRTLKACQRRQGRRFQP